MKLIRFFKRGYKKLRSFIVANERARMNKVCAYDKSRQIRYILNNRNIKEAELALICFEYHRLEKGFTMPERHMPFGQDVVHSLVSRMSRCRHLYTDEFIFRHAVAVLKRYQILHQEEKAYEQLEQNLRTKLEAFLAFYPEIQPDCIQSMSRDAYFSNCAAPFEEFSASRHSVRHFAGSVTMKQIEQAVSLARNAPSACNRQHARVHCICDKKMQSSILELQNGNRGFGHLADKLLIVTSDLCDLYCVEERNEPYINGGIFLMNLCYALHYNKVATCILNWFTSPEQDSKLRKVVGIPDNEVVICIVACGDCPEQFLYANSPRKPLQDILTIH